MGCFLECFGPHKKGRRRRVRARRSRSQPGERVLSYSFMTQPRRQYLSRFGVSQLQEHVEPLLPTSVLTQKVATEERVPEKKETRKFRPVLRKESGRSLSSILKKKVTFDLDVTAYEALPYEQDSAVSLDENELLKENTKEDQQEEEQKLPSSHLVLAYPSNHRYRNCMNVDDEEDIEELDYDDEDDYEEEEFEDEEDGDGRCFDDGKKLGTIDLESRDEDSYVHSILNSVENFSLWKEIPLKQHLEEKENINLVGEAPLMSWTTESSFNSQKFQLNLSRRADAPLKKELAIDASLSNWLTPPRN